MHQKFNKVLLITVLLSAFSTTALAINNGNNGNGNNGNGNDNNSNSSSSSSSNSAAAAAALAGASATAGAIGLGGKGGTGIGGNGTGIGNGGNADVSFEDKLQIPSAPGLSSGSSNTTAKHRIYQQRQVSTFLGGYTNIDMILDIVSFVGSEPTADEELAACIQSNDYRTFRKLQNNECPKF